MRSPVEVDGIAITPFSSIDEAVDAIVPREGVVEPGFAIAINAEKVVSAARDAGLMACIHDATICYADGAPIAWALSRRGVSNVRIPGCDLWEALMRRAGRDGIPVFLLGGRREVNELVRSRLGAELGTPIAGAADGYFDDSAAMIHRIAGSDARIVTVAMGSPAQELFIRKCRRAHPEAFYMGVGGSYDVFIGVTKRAPAWMRDNNLEWLYRLVTQPWRVRRQAALVRYVLMRIGRHR